MKPKQLLHSAAPLLAQAKQRLSDGMDSLEAKVDNLEHHHRNLLRVGAIAVVLSTGIDVTLLL